MASQLYYYCLCLAALAVGIYNFSASSTGKTLVCWSNTSLTYDQYVEYNNSLNKSINIARPTDNQTTYDVPKSGSNILTIFQFILAIIYLSILGLTFILALIVNYLSNQVPEDFLKIGKCKSFLALFCKVFPPLIVIIHWVALFLIIANWIMILMESCKLTTTTVPGTLIIPSQYYSDSRICLLVTSAIWIFLHYCGAILKDLSYVEPFMYSPRTEESSAFAHVVLKTLGP